MSIGSISSNSQNINENFQSQNLEEIQQNQERLAQQGSLGPWAAFYSVLESVQSVQAANHASQATLPHGEGESSWPVITPTLNITPAVEELPLNTDRNVGVLPLKVSSSIEGLPLNINKPTETVLPLNETRPVEELPLSINKSNNVELLPLNDQRNTEPSKHHHGKRAPLNITSIVQQLPMNEIRSEETLPLNVNRSIEAAPLNVNQNTELLPLTVQPSPSAHTDPQSTQRLVHTLQSYLEQLS